MTTTVIGLIGDRDTAITAHQAIDRSFQLAAERLPFKVAGRWCPTRSIPPSDPGSALGDCQGLWCVPGSPYHSLDGALAAIRFARENLRPFLGTCGGFQHALLEYFRNVLHLPNADHEELAPGAPDPVISRLQCPLVEKQGLVHPVPGTRFARIHDAADIRETYHCRFGLSPGFAARLAEGPFRIAARDEHDEVRAVELEGHPCFFATLYQPERAALGGVLHPLVEAFLQAANRRAIENASPTLPSK